MPIKKSDLYASIWKSCDQLRGGMDASQYKDYVLTILFIKYVSDKYSGRDDALLIIPDGSSFDDMVALKGKADIGDRINKEIIAPIAEANDLKGVIDQTDFNDDEKLGSGKDKVNRLSNLIGIFQDANLDFGGNHAGDDDLLGDAYEYLMRNFATESGKSKGQFYTPAEVSRILAKVIGVENADSPALTAYDPTAGSGSLILKVADEAPVDITIYGQEMDVATTALAKMNMVLHNRPEAVHDIMRGNTLADPKFTDSGSLKRFDFVVANPPFSFKSWTNGLDPENDPYNRFEGFGIPPSKNGDYAFLLHIVKSLKSTGTAAVILPHGVLFRGNAEGRIRENLIERGYIKGIIGLPANLFYGTGIPACILVLDKEQAGSRDGIFMIDGSEGYLKDGNKNRLRERDIHKIVDLFREQKETAGFSRFVPNEEIRANEYNLNIPRYIDSSTEEDIQDIEGHLKGGIPERDVEGMNRFWEVYPGIKDALFEPLRDGYLQLKVEKDAINESVFAHPEFSRYSTELSELFEGWKSAHYESIKTIDADTRPKEFIAEIAEDLLDRYRGKALIDPYDIYQHLMNYWFDTLRDDVYMIVEDGWTATLEPVRNSKGKIKKGEFTCELIPKELVIDRYFSDQKAHIEELKQQQEEALQMMEESEQEHAVEGGLLEEAMSDSGNVTKGNLTSRMKEIKDDREYFAEYATMKHYKKCYDLERKAKKMVKEAEKKLDKQVIENYPQLTEDEVKTLVVDDKWLPTIKGQIDDEVEAISRSLTQRVNELAGRYDKAVVEIDEEVNELENRVQSHLEAMGVEWS
ncbi:type I restriction-modification system subunit M [Rhodohalobacter sp. SW132]|uniref:type I restriction-modification system subunit M n=1 Tax=Rhodohalobacter sp. SW132 TaxID=2293433 RepID=UPI000E27B18B|nr:type I restriction-modification system subunit M [Rhodohalobacter sp. SW132]REL32983.1 type I restriction-modification system subunit M [Rhodohalobacter sp. SW132]